MATEWTYSVCSRAPKFLALKNKIDQSKVVLNLHMCIAPCARVFPQIFLALVLLITTSSMAQNVVWSDPVKVSRDVHAYGYLGSDSNGFLVVEENKKEKSLKFIRYTLKDLKVESGVVQSFTGGSNGRFEAVVIMQNIVMMFTSSYSKESEQHQIFCTMLDMQGNKIAEPALVHYVLAENEESAPDFGITFSPDSTKMLLYFDPPFARKSTESISFKCYDSTLDLLWEKDILLPYAQEIIQVHSFLMDNTGNVYMMSGSSPAKDSRQWQKPQGSRYVVFFYNPKEKKLKEYDISLKDKQVLSVRFTLNAEQDVIICGYYSNDFKFSAAGTFLFAISSFGGPVKSATFMPFSQEFVAKLVKKSRVDEGSIPDFFLDNIFLHKDGSITLIGEQFYTSEFVITDPTTGRQTIEYRLNYDDLIATRIDPNGRHTWNTKIPKRQYTASDTGNFSYQCFEDEDKILIFFNDHLENEQKLSSMPEGEASLWQGGRNSVTTRVELAADGKFKRESVVQNKDKDVLLSPAFGNSDLKAPFILGFSENKSYRFCSFK